MQLPGCHQRLLGDDVAGAPHLLEENSLRTRAASQACSSCSNASPDMPSRQMMSWSGVSAADAGSTSTFAPSCWMTAHVPSWVSETAGPSTGNLPPPVAVGHVGQAVGDAVEHAGARA